MHYILQEDERRRFTLGFTIEQDSMRLWYANRSTIFVSEAFNFISVSEPILSPSRSWLDHVHSLLNILFASFLP